MSKYRHHVSNQDSRTLPTKGGKKTFYPPGCVTLEERAHDSSQQLFMKTSLEEMTSVFLRFRFSSKIRTYMRLSLKSVDSLNVSLFAGKKTTCYFLSTQEFLKTLKLKVFCNKQKKKSNIFLFQEFDTFS